MLTYGAHPSGGSRRGLPSWIRGWSAAGMIVLGALCLVAGVVAGYVHRAVLDADRFAASVDELRREPAVSAALGRSLTDAVLQQHPDAVAVRPLIDSVAASVVGSDLLTGPTRAAAVSFQRSLTEPEAQVFALRVADAGAVLTSVLQRVAPETSISGDSTVSLELARIGGQSFAGRTIHLARFVRVASWVLPLAGAALMAVGVLLAERRRRAVWIAGLALLAGTALLALALLVGAAWAGARDDGTVAGALVRHGWPIVVGPAWWSVLAVGAVGLLLSASAAALVPEVDPAAVLGRAWALAARRPRRRTTQVLRSVALLVVGAAFVVRPALLVGVAGVLAGAWLMLYGVHELAVATKDEELTSRPRLGPIAVRGRASTRPARRVGLPVGAAALTVLALVVTWGAMPASSAPVTSPGTVAGRGEVCEGYAVLCARRYPEVAFAASHNAMATASDRAWFIPEQGPSIIGQLDDGVRALLIDVWPGFPTTQGRVATARSAYAAAKAQLERELGPETVAAGLRVASAVTNPTPAGPEDLYMCHGLCELGATQFLPAMAEVRVWMDTHPDEVLTIVIEDHVPAAAIGAALVASGLAAYAATPPAAGQPWPTLREMTTSGRRLYLLLEGGDGGAAYPWLANAYRRLVQETPYTAPTLADLSTCRPNRGSPTAPLLLVNHWLSGFGQLVANARRANTLTVLSDRAELCRTERQLPNYIAVNYADIGDLQTVVRQLNGVG